ncbi:MAG TPA: UrcA family protein [Rhizomicrobium sp.]|nr:UrcA family protein [Rhizomicrobium sp.]
MSRVLAVSFAVIVALAGAAHAENADGMIRHDVAGRYGDLDIASESGARMLLARIDHAAAQACGGSPYFYSIYSTAPALAKEVFVKCHDEAVGRAVASLNSPVVTQVYASNGLPRIAGR